MGRGNEDHRSGPVSLTIGCALALALLGGLRAIAWASCSTDGAIGHRRVALPGPVALRDGPLSTLATTSPHPSHCILSVSPPPSHFFSRLCVSPWHLQCLISTGAECALPCGSTDSLGHRLYAGPSRVSAVLPTLPQESARQALILALSDTGHLHLWAESMPAASIASAPSSAPSATPVGALLSRPRLPDATVAFVAPEGGAAAGRKRGRREAGAAAPGGGQVLAMRVAFSTEGGGAQGGAWQLALAGGTPTLPQFVRVVCAQARPAETGSLPRAGNFVVPMGCIHGRHPGEIACVRLAAMGKRRAAGETRGPQLGRMAVVRSLLTSSSPSPAPTQPFLEGVAPAIRPTSLTIPLQARMPLAPAAAPLVAEATPAAVCTPHSGACLP